MMYVYIFYIP